MSGLETRPSRFLFPPTARPASRDETVKIKVKHTRWSHEMPTSHLPAACGLTIRVMAIYDNSNSKRYHCNRWREHCELSKEKRRLTWEYYNVTHCVLFVLSSHRIFLIFYKQDPLYRKTNTRRESWERKVWCLWLYLYIGIIAIK